MEMLKQLTWLVYDPYNADVSESTNISYYKIGV